MPFGRAEHQITLLSPRLRSLVDACQKSRLFAGMGPHAIRHAVGHAYARAKLPVTVTQRKLGHRLSPPKITTQTANEYVAQVSRRYELLALLPEDEQDGFTPRLIPKTGSA